MWKSFLEVVRFILTKFDPVSSHGDPVRAKSYMFLLIFWNFTFSLSNIFSNGVNNVGSLELRPKGKSNFRWSSTTSLFCKKAFSYWFLPRFSRFVKGPPLSHFKPFWDPFYRDFVPDKYPMSGPIQVAYILGFPTLGEPAGLAGWFQICPGNPQEATGGTRKVRHK